MPTLVITKTWNEGEILTEAMLDYIKTDTETFFNTTGISSQNIQEGGIATSNLTASCVTTAKLGTNSIITAKINDAAVTNIKLEADNEVQATTGSGSNATTTYATIGSQSVSLSCTGRPVMYVLAGDDGTGSSIYQINGAGIGINILRNGSSIGYTHIGGLSLTDASRCLIPSGCITGIDFPGVGTHTYAVQLRCLTTSYTAVVDYVQLFVYEIL